MKSKQSTCKENHIETHNEIAEIKEKEEILKATRENDTLCIGEQCISHQKL